VGGITRHPSPSLYTQQQHQQKASNKSSSRSHWHANETRCQPGNHWIPELRCQTIWGYYEPMVHRRRRKLRRSLRTHVLGPYAIVRYSRKPHKAWGDDGTTTMFVLGPAIATSLTPGPSPSRPLLPPLSSESSFPSLFFRPFLKVGPRRARLCVSTTRLCRGR